MFLAILGLGMAAASIGTTVYYQQKGVERAKKHAAELKLDNERALASKTSRAISNAMASAAYEQAATRVELDIREDERDYLEKTKGKGRYQIPSEPIGRSVEDPRESYGLGRTEDA